MSELDGAAVSTGLLALDHILGGGYARNRSHLIEGHPGSGKTTLALQFMAAGVAIGERCLYITLSETAAELRYVAATHGLSLEGVQLVEIMPQEMSSHPAREQSVFYSSELELGETIQAITDSVRVRRPQRVVFDSLSEIRILAQGTLRYRRQVLALKQFFAQEDCTVLMLDDLTQQDDDLNLHSISHGVLRLEHIAAAYGAERRRLRVFKMRARDFSGGYHDFVIRRGGLNIFPRLVAADHGCVAEDKTMVASGVDALDELLGGGLDRGTSTLLLGPSGTGKSTLALQFVKAALDRGESALFVSFDETRRNFQRRSLGMNMDMQAHLDDGRLVYRQIDPAEMTPGEMSAIVRDHVTGGARIVVLDSLSGYKHAMPEESFILLQMHELLTYLSQQGVVTILILSQSGIIGDMDTPFNISYLADTLLLLRFFEVGGEIRRALSVIKKRTGFHERSIRELFFDSHGVQVGPKLAGFRGVLSGTPSLVEGQAFLVERDPGGQD